MAGAAGGLSVASAGLSAFGSIESGFSKGRNDARQGESQFLQGMQGVFNSNLEASGDELKAAQTDIVMRERLAGTLSNITAVAASAGVSGDSPSTEAIYNRTAALSDRARTTMTGNLYRQASVDRDSAVLQMLGAYSALQQGYANQKADEMNGILGAGGGLLKSFSGLSF